jgi:hypothetical protein
VFFSIIIVLGGVHCGIYKSSYNASNILYLNSLPRPTLLCFIPSPPDSWNSFNRYHFCIYLHVYTSFALYSPPTPFLCCLLPNLFHPTILWFWRRKNIKDKKRNMVFLLVWDKDIYMERFLVLFPGTCVLQPQLVHLYQSSSLLPSPLPIVAPTSLRFLYSFLCSEHINHIDVFGSLPLLYPSCVQSALSVTCVP